MLSGSIFIYETQTEGKSAFCVLFPVSGFVVYLWINSFCSQFFVICNFFVRLFCFLVYTPDAKDSEKMHSLFVIAERNNRQDKKNRFDRE